MQFKRNGRITIRPLSLRNEKLVSPDVELPEEVLRRKTISYSLPHAIDSLLAVLVKLLHNEIPIHLD